MCMYLFSFFSSAHTSFSIFDYTATSTQVILPFFSPLLCRFFSLFIGSLFSAAPPAQHFLYGTGMLECYVKEVILIF